MANFVVHDPARSGRFSAPKCVLRMNTRMMGVFQIGGKLPFDKLRANGQAYSFALSLSKGKFAPN
jgi:hypothetical protein